MTCVAQNSQSLGNGWVQSTTASYTSSTKQNLLLVGGNGGGHLTSTSAEGFCGTFSAYCNGVSINLSQIGGCAVAIISVKSGDTIQITSSVNTGNPYVCGGGHMAVAIYTLK